MSADMQFGDLEESSPQVRPRPDRNRHYAVVAVDSPQPDDLPIFVDVDVLRDMESHALSDTNVELGGVLLGGQYEDEQGEAFVVVTDSLRAKHYESTKGSFKFTHETWSEITRQREAFPEELQMVGWYHTHPDWGVFLSGMDMFICDNFFNKPLDVALVIDPCRGDRGMYQWTGDVSERIRRTGGFYLIASRFRERELAMYAQQLKGPVTMTDPRMAPGAYTSPVVNIADHRNSWQTIAVLGMLLMQFCLLAVIAWKMMGSPADSAEASEKQLAALDEKLDSLMDINRATAQIEFDKKFLDQVVASLAKGSDGMLESMRKQQEGLEQMRTNLYGHQARIKELEGLRGAQELAFSEYKTEKKREIEQLLVDISRYRLRDKDQQKRIAALSERLRELDPEAFAKSDGDAELADGGMFARNRTLIAISGGVLAAVVLAGVLMFFYRREDMEREREADENADTSSSAQYNDENTQD